MAYYNGKKILANFSMIVSKSVNPGGSGGNSDLIDVSELPTTVDDSKIYRKEGNISAVCYIAEKSDEGEIAFAEIGTALSWATEQSIYAKYVIVNELPLNPQVTDETIELGYIYIYILSSTHEGWVYGNFVEDGEYNLSWIPLSFLASVTTGGEVFENKGKVESTANITEQGIYTIYSVTTAIGVPNENIDKTVFYWDGQMWEQSNFIVIKENENLPDVGIEGAIYFRKNVPSLMYSNVPLISALSDGRIIEKAIIVKEEITNINGGDGIVLPVYYLKTNNGYTVGFAGLGDWLEVEDNGYESESIYIGYNNEIWYFRNGKYVRISTDEFSRIDTIPLTSTTGGYFYTGDLYSVNFKITPATTIFKSGVSGEIKKEEFRFDPFWEATQYSVPTGALAGCDAVTRVEPFEISIMTAANNGEMGDAAFYGCKGLTTIDIDAKRIGKHAFYDCISLREAHIYQANIGEYAFANCTSLTDIYFNGTKADWQAGIFERGWNENTGNYTVHCTDGDIAKS